MNINKAGGRGQGAGGVERGTCGNSMVKKEIKK